jgi:hypothetical protein
MFHSISVQLRRTQLLKQFLSPGNVLVKKGSLKANLLEHLAHDCWKSIHKVIFDIKAGRTECSDSSGATLKAHFTINSSRGPTLSKTETNSQITIFVSMLPHVLKNVNVMMVGGEFAEFLQNKIDSLHIPPF